MDEMHWEDDRMVDGVVSITQDNDTREMRQLNMKSRTNRSCIEHIQCPHKPSIKAYPQRQRRVLWPTRSSSE